MHEAPPPSLTSDLIRELAGTGSYERGHGYHRDGNVGDVTWVTPEAVRATVEGSTRYITQLRFANDTVAAACTCPVGARGDFCKHAVAIALRLIDEPAERENEPASPVVVPRRNANASRRGSSPSPPSVSAAKANLQAAFRVSGFLDWRRTGRWGLEAYAALDALEPLIDTAPASVVALCEYALRRCDVVAERVDDSNGEIGDLIYRARQLHLAACTAADEAPVALAKRLFALEADSSVELLLDVYRDYADVLEASGRDTYRELAERAWINLQSVSSQDDHDLRMRRWRVARILEQVARADRDVARIVEIVGDGFTNSWAYARVARACLDIEELEAALKWAIAGRTAAPNDRRIDEVLADVHVALGQDERAAEAYWPSFAQLCALSEYARLHRYAEPAGTWPTWRERALARAREFAADAAHDASALVDLLLHEGDTDEAWLAAQAFGCSPRALELVALAREVSHPVDSARVYLDRARGELDHPFAQKRYDLVVSHLARADALLATPGERSLFDEAVASLRSDHARKRTLMAKLDSRGWM